MVRRMPPPSRCRFEQSCQFGPGLLVQSLGRLIRDEHGAFRRWSRRRTRRVGPCRRRGCAGTRPGRMSEPKGRRAGFLPSAGRPRLSVGKDGGAFGDLFPGAHGGVQGERGFLWQQGHQPAPEPAAVCPVGQVERLAVHGQGSPRREVRRECPHDRMGQQGLPRTAFADDRHRTSALKVQGGHIDQGVVSVADVEVVQAHAHWRASLLRRLRSPIRIVVRTRTGARDIHGAS